MHTIHTVVWLFGYTASCRTISLKSTAHCAPKYIVFNDVELRILRILRQSAHVSSVWQTVFQAVHKKCVCRSSSPPKNSVFSFFSAQRWATNTIYPTVCMNPRGMEMRRSTHLLSICPWDDGKTSTDMERCVCALFLFVALRGKRSITTTDNIRRMLMLNFRNSAQCLCGL